jgi:hypothetical protein
MQIPRSAFHLRICGIGEGGLVDELSDAAVRVVDGPPRRVADVGHEILDDGLRRRRPGAVPNDVGSCKVT